MGHDPHKPGPPGFDLTRRQFLKGAAAAAAVHSFGPPGSQRVRFREVAPHRVQFELNGAAAWVIDTRHFEGSPVLSARTDATGQLSLALTGATYPGTGLPAGFQLDLRQDQMDLRLDLGGFAVRGVPFTDWLAGTAAASAPVSLSGATWGRDPCHLNLRGTTAQATFHPDWRLTLTAPGVAELDYGKQTLKADQITIATQHGPGTRITLNRGEEPWPAILPAAAPRLGRLLAGPRLFERATLELTGQKATLHLDGDAPLSFQPAGQLRGKDGRALTFPLHSPRYTADLTSQTATLTAQPAPEQVYALAGDAVLVLTATPKTPPFAWTERPGAAPALQFQPAFVTLAAAGMEGLVVSASTAGAASSASFTGDGLSISLTNLEVVRPSDLLSLSFSFKHLTLQTTGSGAPVLIPTGSGTPEMAVTFPPQHIAEQAVYDGIPAREDPAPPVTSRLAGNSTLTFKLLAGQLPFTLEDLLSWHDPARFELIAGDGSQLEIPYRLFMAVPAATRWLHSPTPVADGKRTELWHTRADGTLEVRYTTPDSKSDSPEFLTSLRPRDRWQIADRTQNRDEAEISRLMLSSLGGWLMARGSWDVTNADTENSLAFWSHQIAMGRDVKVVVVEDGYLAPFGHRASQITISERKFQRGRAYLRQKTFIVVRQPVKLYDKDDLPFERVELLTLNTPPLDLGSFDTNPYWAVVGGAKFPFQVSALDKMGQTCEFLLPMAWVAIADQSQVDDEFYNAEAYALRTAALQGQRVAFAPAAESTAGDVTTQSSDTNLDALQLRFKVVTGQSHAASDPDRDALFRAQLDRARVRVPAVEQFSETGGAVDIRYHSIYLDHRFTDQNPWQVFAELVQPDDGAGQQNRDMKVPVSNTGGLVMPSFQMKTLTRGQGPSGVNPTRSESGSYDNSFRSGDIFSSFAKLLGVIPFGSILQDLTNVSKTVLDEVKNRGKTIGPYLAIEYKNERDPFSQKVDKKLRATLYLDVSTAVSPNGGGLKDAGPFRVRSTFDPNLNTAVRLIFILEKDLGGKDEQGEKRKKARKLSYGAGIEALWFDLVLGPLKLSFERVALELGPGINKFNLKMGPSPFELTEALSAVANLTKYLPRTLGAGDPDETEKLSSGIVYGIELALTDLPRLGALEIRTIKPWFWVVLPTTDVPISFRIGVSLRHDPFVFAVYLGAAWGIIGGGYFSIWFTPTRVTHVEVQLEAGGFVGFSAGPVKGEVTIRLGLYLHLQLGAGYDVTGFLRITGKVSLKIVTVSIEIYLAMSYFSQGDYWEGMAKFSISVTIGIFEISFSATVRKKLNNGSSSSAQQLALPGGAQSPGLGRQSRRRAAAYCQAFCHSYA